MLAIAWHNLRRRKIHFTLLLLTVILATASLSSSQTLIQGVKQGLQGSIERMGADILVSPYTLESNTSEQILFSGRPVNLYMDKEVLGKIAAIPGVTQVSAQFFTQTLDASCCTVAGVDRIVGIDSQTDFVLKPWLEENIALQGGLHKDEMIAGGLAPIPLGGKVYVLGNLFTVVGRLQPVGGSVDTSLFIPIDQARSLAGSSPSLKEYWQNGRQPDQLISAVLIRISNQNQSAEVIRQIQAMGGVTAVATSEVLRNSQQAFSVLENSLNAILIALWLIVLLGLISRYAVFSLERKREFGLLRALGAQKQELFQMVIYEALITAGLGGVIGLLAASGLVYAAAGMLEKYSSYPFILPQISSIIVIALITLLLSMATGFLASVVPAWHCAGLEPVKAITQGELE